MGNYFSVEQQNLDEEISLSNDDYNEMINDIINSNIKYYDNLNDLLLLLKTNYFKTLIKAINSCLSSLDDNKKQTIIDQLKQWEKYHKEKFHPESNNSELKQLKLQAINALELSSNKDKVEEYRQLLIEIAKKRDDLSQDFQSYDKVINILQIKIASIINLLSGKGRSNRANRAGLLSKHAGKNRICNASTDKHGNALGDEYDLGVDGAFKGMEIIVIQLYPFTKEHTVKAFTKKGFSFQWFTSVPSPNELKKLLNLETVCQLWIIGSSGRSFNNNHLEIIKDFHKDGKSLYIWGDNDPYISDANVVLSYLYDSKMKMFGNEYGMKIVHLCENPSNEKPNSGFISHLITTGLVHLYEGATVASFNEQNIISHKFSPLMWGSACNLITIYREADSNGGAVMCDGAFTRLYCNVDDAGTIRYIINCACWLAIESFANTSSFEEEEDDDDESNIDIPKYDITNAFQGKCSILWEEVPIVYLSIMELIDVEINTSDYVLNDPLGFGENNYKIIGRYLYAESTGKAVLEMGRDPYLRQNVAGLLPVVCLSNPTNFSLFSEELCRVFMGCRRLFSAAQLIFVSSLDSMLHPDRINDYDKQLINVLHYFMDECLNNIKTTPDFTDIGDKIPLIKAMQHYFSVETDMIQISKSFSTVCLIARILLERNLIPKDTLSIIVRRSLYKYIVNATLRYVKENSKNSNGNILFQTIITDLMYNCWNHIPKNNTGRIISQLPDYISDIYKHSLDRYEKLANINNILHYPSITLLFSLLMKEDLRLFKVESLLIKLQQNTLFKECWNGELVKDTIIIDILNSKFTIFKVSKSHFNDSIIPFATTFGPSIFSCNKCTVKFGDPNHEPSEEYAESIKKLRNSHFMEHYNSDINGYPKNDSHHFSLHRSIQLILCKDIYKDKLELSQDMIDDVALLIKNLKGNIYRSNIENIIEKGIISYLECRKRGDKDPSGYVKFYERYIMERNALLNIK